jgi:hypothetical protein
MTTGKLSLLNRQSTSGGNPVHLGEPRPRSCSTLVAGDWGLGDFNPHTPYPAYKLLKTQLVTRKVGMVEFLCSTLSF